MVDLSKHLERANKAIKGRNYDLALQVCLECQEVDPANLDNYQVLLDAARRRQKEGGKRGILTTIGGLLGKLSRDPGKRLSVAAKMVSQSPDEKSLAGLGDAARTVFEDTGNQGMAQVAIFFYEEVRKSGLLNTDVLWHVAQVYHGLYGKTKDPELLEQAITAMAELRKVMPTHPDAGRTLQNWEALRSMSKRTVPGGQDYSTQLASGDEARKNEAMGRIIRTRADAEEVLRFVDADLEKDPRNKQMWQKRGDVLRRINELQEARDAYAKAAEIDPHDFNTQVQIGDCDIALARRACEEAERSGGDVAARQAALHDLQMQEYRRRIERQPTEGRHRYELGRLLLTDGEIDAAAAEFQRAVGDSRYKKSCHRLLGQCFLKKKLHDLAIDQFTAYLAMSDDDHADESKDVLYQRARVYEQTGRVEEAKGDLRRLVEIDLGYKDAADRLSKL